MASEPGRVQVTDFAAFDHPDTNCCASTLDFTFASPSTLASYDLQTANDADERDPTSWTLFCVLDGQDVVLDSRAGFAAPTARLAAYGLGVLAPRF